MATMNPSEMLTQRIASLERQLDTDLIALKYQLHETGQSLKPSNIVKSAVQDVAENDQVRSVFKKAVIGISLGLIAKMVLSRKKKKKPFNLMRTAMSIGINMLISNRYALLKSVGAMAISALASNLFNKKSNHQEVHEDSTPDSFHGSYSRH